MRLSFGTTVECQDGSFGELADVVVDPETMRLTHLITSPPGAAEPRLIPIELAEAGDGGVRLRCTLADTEELASVLEYRNLRSTDEPVEEPGWDEGVEHVVAMPYEGIGLGLGQYDGLETAMNVSYDRVPEGSAELRRASSIVTADGHYLGGVEAFGLDEAGRITEVVLDESHFWSRREITIPVDAIREVATDSVTVGLSSAEVSALPAVRRRRWF